MGWVCTDDCVDVYIKKGGMISVRVSSACEHIDYISIEQSVVAKNFILIKMIGVYSETKVYPKPKVNLLK